MRALPIAAAVALLAGCQVLLGLEDPVPAGDGCALFQPSCAGGETCDTVGAAGELGCRAIGPGGPGALCGEPEDCAAGTSCSDGVCRTFCAELGEACAAPEAACVRNWFDHLVCDSACDVREPATCGAGRECMLMLNHLGDPIALCVPRGWFGDAGADSPCTFIAECGPGLGCYDGDSDGEGVCTAVCAVGEPCAGGATCVDVFRATLHGERIGLCATGE